MITTIECHHPLWAPQSRERGYCDACRVEHGQPQTPPRDNNPVDGIPCIVCDLGINPVLGIVAHYDCASVKRIDPITGNAIEVIDA